MGHLDRVHLQTAAARWVALPQSNLSRNAAAAIARTTHVLQAAPEFQLLGKNSLDATSWASPAVAGGAVFLRSVDHLFSIQQCLRFRS